MSIRWTEALLVISSLATGGFVGWQAYLFQTSANSPFEANLQSRIIDACAEVISANSAYNASLSWPSLRELLSNYRALEFVEPTSDEPRSSFTGRVINPDMFDPSVATFSSHFDRLSADWNDPHLSLQSAIARLEIYTSSGPVPFIYAYREAVSHAQAVFFVRSAASDDRAFETARTNLHQAFMPIESRCKEVMLGDHRGLL